MRNEFINKYFIPLQILQAQNFQEMYLKVILERSTFSSEYVCLGKISKTHFHMLTSYFLLPVSGHGGKETLTIDWPLITRCLSSPIFQSHVGKTGVVATGNYLKLAEGLANTHDIMDSLVFVPYKNSFFFVSGILDDKNGWSPYQGKVNFVEHYLQE